MTSIEVKLENENIWLNQAQIASLFKRDRTVITKHVNNIFKEKSVKKKAMCKKCMLLIQIH